ncbi:MAG TPA: MBL fold metallo-hydrolase [Gemmatimonadaceae bacterium]|nr:MBL fold metallo-hydrolase [Gemmatimonadaceae bacterium]
MLFKRYFDDKLAQASYLVACEHSRLGLIVDPNRDISHYIAAAAQERVRIVAVTETHIHADFVSGARELAAQTGATLYLSDMGGPEWQYGFLDDRNIERLTDGSRFTIGDVQVEAVLTPGHTPEHMTFLLTDTSVATEPMGALTGDFIFVGDVGRPDLLERAAGITGTMETGARQLYQSIQSFKLHPDYLQIWPGHGAGSACGKALGAMPQSTLGYEKLFNWALAESDEQRFVDQVLEGQPEPPAYFAIMKKMNRDGPGARPKSIPREASADEIANALDTGADVVDMRSTADFASMHLKRTINIPQNKSFLNWAGALLPYDRPLWFIGDATEAGRQALADDLSLIGLERIAGVLPATAISTVRGGGAPLESTEQIRIADAKNDGAAAIIDVRSRAEFAEGHIPGATNIPLAELQRRLTQVAPGPLVVHCQGGSRAAMAASILKRSGRNEVKSLAGGFTEWERSGNRVERGRPPDGS